MKVGNRFLNKFASKLCKRSSPYLNNVSSLPCETWNAYRTRATLELSQKETPDFIPPQLWPANSPDLNPVNYSVWGLLQEKVYKTRHWPAQTETATENRVGQLGLKVSYMSSLRRPFVSSVVDSSRAVMRVLHTFCCNISNMMLSTEYKSGDFWGHSWGGLTSGVSFCNNSTV